MSKPTIFCPVAGCNSKYKTQKGLEKHILFKHPIGAQPPKRRRETKPDAENTRGRHKRQCPLDRSIKKLERMRKECTPLFDELVLHAQACGAEDDATHLKAVPRFLLSNLDNAIQIAKRVTALEPPAATEDVAGSECVACMDAPRGIMLTSCGHVALCASCVGMLSKPECPICRTAFTPSQVIRAIIS